MWNFKSISILKVSEELKLKVFQITRLIKSKNRLNKALRYIVINREGFIQVLFLESLITVKLTELSQPEI